MKNATYRRLITSTRWLRLRKTVLSHHPLCANCEANGLYVPATELHHVRPVQTALSVAEAEALCFDAHNVRPLCHDCHVREHIRLGKSGREAAKNRTAEKLRAIRDKYL